MRSFLFKHRVDAISPHSFLLQMSLLHVIPKQNKWLNLSIELVLFPIVKNTVLILERTAACVKVHLCSSKHLSSCLKLRKHLRALIKREDPMNWDLKKCYS